jgi:hypothetical protein
MLGDGFEQRRLLPVENRTVVTSPREGCRNNRWEHVLTRNGLTFTPLTDVEWRVYPFKRGLGIADPRQIELVGDDVWQENFGFQTRRSLVSGATRLIRRGFLRPLERLLLHSPLMGWAPFASNVYHDLLWYPTIGQSRIRSFMRTEWGQLFRKY